MYNAPELISNIEDIKQLYAINAEQEEELEEAVEQLDDNIFIDTMDMQTLSKWEVVAGLKYFDDDTEEIRRFRLKAKLLEKPPYTEKSIRQRVNQLCPDGVSFEIREDRKLITVKLALKSKRMIDIVRDYLEGVIPLNMWFTADILWNQYKTIKQLKYSELVEKTCKELREEVIE